MVWSEKFKNKNMFFEILAEEMSRKLLGSYNLDKHKTKTYLDRKNLGFLLLFPTLL